MEEDELTTIDLLSFISDELVTNFRNAKDDGEKGNIIWDFLRRWDGDPSLDKVKSMQIEFEQDLDWFNVIEPLTLSKVRGKLVILDFFTYCCINCMHVLPELNALEKLYPQEQGLTVIGVHSPKFANEKDSANILYASQRYGIEHPIVNDSNMKLWGRIGIRCWPSLLILNPRGEPLILLMGEGHQQFLECFVHETLRYYSKRNEIQNFVIPISLTDTQLPASKLRFPAKIARLSNQNIFALADAGNNRILIFNREGQVLQKIGGNDKGFADGDFENVRFNSPQGVVFLNENELIVADTENHALRKITLNKRMVETLAGTGSQGNDRIGGKEGPYQIIASPWDVAVFRTRDMDMSFHVDEKNVQEKDILLISMAGTHQIWGYFPEGIIWWKFRKFEPKTCVSLVGNGLEENRNNSYPQNAAFAQPSGLTIANDFLFIADSESSSIRKVSMLDGKVMAVVGGDRNPANLFAFGDVDGKQYNAKLQHPIAITFNDLDGKLYVADTYNHKIKGVDITTNCIESVPIKNEMNELIQFNEPAGLCFDVSGKYLFVSDTNAHQLQLVDMESMIATKFRLNFDAFSMARTETDSIQAYKLVKKLPLNQIKDLKLNISIELSEGLKFTTEAPQKWSVTSANSTLRSIKNSGKIIDGNFFLHFERAVEKSVTDENISLNISLCLCDDNSCLIKSFLLMLCNGNTNETVNGSLEDYVKLHLTKGTIKLIS